MQRCLGILFFFMCTMLLGCAPSAADVAPTGVTTENLTAGEAARFIRGGLLFQFEEFHGNDRTCGDCHRPLSFFDLSPQDVQSIHQIDADNPLFRPLDSNDGVGNDYSDMINDGLVRVHVVLAPNVTVDDVDGVNVSIRPDGRYVVALRRSTPTVLNVGLEQHLMWDGREGADLAHQALSAAIDHAQVTQTPTASQLSDIAFFQRQLFSSSTLASYAHGGAEPVLPAGRNDSEERGHAFFVSGPLSAAAGTHGLCATCHSGPMLNRTNAFNPGDPPDLAFSGNRISEFNPRGMPTHTYHITAATDLLNDNPVLGPLGSVMYPQGTVFTLTTPDPGALVVDTDPSDGSDGPANPCISMTACFVVPGSAVVFNRIPTLWGTALTAPYFVDNSAATFEDVVHHYQQFFVPTQHSMLAQAAFLESIGQVEVAAFLRDEAAALTITEQDVTDIAAYMRYAFR